jgi:hypothetical protein
MTVGFVPVDDAAARLCVDLEVDRPMHLAAVGDTRRLDALEDGAELVRRVRSFRLRSQSATSKQPPRFKVAKCDLKADAIEGIKQPSPPS